MSACAWRAASDLLADFTHPHIPVRFDRWGAYTDADRPIIDANGIAQRTYTAPGKKYRGIRRLDHDVLARHYRGERQGHLIGVHATSDNNESRILVADFDNHEGTAERARENFSNALSLCDALRLFGLVPLIEDSDGRGGLHVWTIFAEMVATPTVYAFAIACLAEVGIGAELYPKQAELKPNQIGNWIRLPGRHHTRDHWSRIYASGQWHEGDDAVDLWIHAWLSPSDQLPVPAPRPAPIAAPRLSRTCSTALEHRIASYIDRLPTNLRAGDGRNNVGFTLAGFLVRDLDLADDVALGWLARWNQRQQTPMTDAKLASLVADAHAYGSHGYGSAA